MREIIFDTETTGLDARVERVIEIGAVELENRFPTGRTFHVYINPDGRRVDPEAVAVHGITDEQLVGKPLFAEIVDDFLTFVGEGRLVAHNAGFDQGFINAELGRLGRPALPSEVFVDTLAIARRRHPLGPNSLDALCRRYGIDNSRRVHHGALLDAELLAEVFIEMEGGRQAMLGLGGPQVEVRGNAADAAAIEDRRLPQRLQPLSARLTEDERAAHRDLVERLGAEALWRRYAE